MATSIFLSTLLCLFIGLDTFVTEPTFSTAFTVEGSSESIDPIPIDTSATETDLVPHIEHSNTEEDNRTNKNSNNNNKQKHANANRSNNNDNTNSAAHHERNAKQQQKQHQQPKSICKLVEWKCADGSCIEMAKFCNGHVDCPDKSDELSGCNVCNRTWLGETGKTYEIELDKPKTLPFICHFNLTAAGGYHGDIIQINIDKFNIGRFTSHTDDGCPDGYMIISESNLASESALASNMYGDAPFDVGGGSDGVGGGSAGSRAITNHKRNGNGNGKWCGNAWGYNVYFSESSSINITLKLFKLAQQQPQFIPTSSANSNNNFSFRLTYKFLKRTDAKLRNDKGIWTGDQVPGTYCNKNVYDCDRRICRIRSPNFPGMYPRNLTCKYYIHHRPPPAGLHAMLVVRQPIGQKLYLKDQQQEKHHESTGRSTRMWNHCDMIQDYLSIYDGKNTNFPEIARICGGDALPDIISSGPDMLIVFKSSAFDTLYHPSPNSYLLGFELQVEVIFVNANSQIYTRQPRQCEFTISAFESISGDLDSPKHTLPPNTACRYRFQGRRNEIVWITFAKYHSAVDQAIFEAPSECAAQLRIWDGKLQASKKDDAGENFRNATLITEVCREDGPKLCSRLLISSETRPCSPHESYLSTGPDLTIEFMPNPSGVPHSYGPASAFRLRYEFLDTSLGGAPLTHPASGPKAMPEPAALLQVQTKSCDRVYRSNTATRGIFRSPSNVFMFGRGGSTNISCTIRFEANIDETVRLTITRARFGGRSCQNVQSRSGRWHCNYMGGLIADLRIGELPWLDVPPLPRDCICADISGSLALSPIASSTVEAQFTVVDMNIGQDYRDFYFEGRYEFVKDSCQTNWEARRLHGVSGEAFLGPSSCNGVPIIQPWLLEPESENSYLVLMLKGFWLPSFLNSVPPCPTDARITVYSANNPKASRDLCPSGGDVVAFSDGWDSIHQFNPIEISKNLVIEFRIPWKSSADANDYKISWMEVYPDTECVHKCDELQACISPTLWCNGVKNCPSGQDEDPDICEAKPPLSPLHVGIAVALCTLLLSLIAGLAACARRRRAEKQLDFDADHDELNSMTLSMENNGSMPSAQNQQLFLHHHQGQQRDYRSHRSTSHQHASLSPLNLDAHQNSNYC